MDRHFFKPRFCTQVISNQRRDFHKLKCSCVLVVVTKGLRTWKKVGGGGEGIQIVAIIESEFRLWVLTLRSIYADQHTKCASVLSNISSDNDKLHFKEFEQFLQSESKISKIQFTNYMRLKFQLTLLLLILLNLIFFFVFWSFLICISKKKK